MRLLTLASGAALAALAAGTAHAGAVTQSLSGKASYYDRNYHGRLASGAAYDPEKLTAAHKTLPFGTRLRITDQRTGRSVIVIVNDRGPFTKGRILDLSYAAAVELRMTGRGFIVVNAEGL